MKREKEMTASLVSLVLRHICVKPFSYIMLRNLSHVARLQLPVNPPPPHQSMLTFQRMASDPYVNLLSYCRTLNFLKKLHSSLIVQGIIWDFPRNTKLVSLYGQFGHLRLARLVFDKMPDRDAYSWKTMLRWYYLNNVYSEVIRFYGHMRMFVNEHDKAVFSIVLKACSELKNIAHGRKVHCQVVKSWEPDSVLSCILMDMYGKCGEIECSRSVFDENLDRNVVSWTLMINGYVLNGWPEESLILFNRMREQLIEVNEFTLRGLVSGCTKLAALHQGKWFHGYVIKNGIEFNSFLATSLLDMYVKCSVITDARSVLDEMENTDIFSWTAMIAGYVQSGCPDEALMLFTDRKWATIFPNFVTITSIFSACAQLGYLKFGRSVHGLGIKLGLGEPTAINALVDMYAKCCMNRDTHSVFETIKSKDVVAWNCIICGFAQNGSAYEALELFNSMRNSRVLPDAVTLVGALTASGSIGDFQTGASLHGISIKQGILTSNVYVGTALLTLYAKCGDAKSARMVFDYMEEKSTVTWSAMIGGYGIQGDGHESLALFSDMLKKELQPTEVIFTSILSACSHTGMVGEGWRLFSSMCQDYDFVPSMKHYTCMVDLLARAGKLEDALDFMDHMPVRPDVSVFGAFLHGCGLYSRFDMGEVAIRRMQKLHPDEACYYVLMCNLYASDGRWSQVKDVRELMKQRGLVKSPASSHVSMGSCQSY